MNSEREMSWGWDPSNPTALYKEIRFKCSNCHLPTNLPNLEKDIDINYGLIVLGIHSDVRWGSKRRDFVQYQEGEFEPAVSEKIRLCHRCAERVVLTFFQLVSGCTGISDRDLKLRWDSPYPEKDRGHFVTLEEYRSGKIKHSFNLQVGKEPFREIVIGTPKKIREFHGLKPESQLLILPVHFMAAS